MNRRRTRVTSIFGKEAGYLHDTEALRGIISGHLSGGDLRVLGGRLLYLSRASCFFSQASNIWVSKVGIFFQKLHPVLQELIAPVT